MGNYVPNKDEDTFHSLGICDQQWLTKGAVTTSQILLFCALVENASHRCDQEGAFSTFCLSNGQN